MALKIRLILLVTFSIISLILVSCQRGAEKADDYFQADIVNLDHLDYLCEDVVVEGDSVTIVHIYANYPDYAWLDAGDEGIACVDDAARAAVVYLRYYELTENGSALERARNLLNFLLVMQADDGEFNNFINKDFTINRSGRTSLKSFNFWAARGYWALAYGYRVFLEKDRDYALKLKTRFLKCKGPLRKLMDHYEEYRQVEGRDYPAWLLNECGSDATSEFLLGLGHYFQVEDDAELRTMASKLVEGVLAMQLDEEDAYQGAFLSWLNIWHAYANCQTQALAVLGPLLDEESWLAAAEEEARAFYPRLIDEGFMYSFIINKNVEINRFSQIAYGIRPVVVGLIMLYNATGNEEYAVNAGLLAAWFFGRNPPRMEMYDINSGRCFDGIDSNTKVNMNSGAESTIEALMSLLEVASHRKVYESLANWLKQEGKSTSIER